MLLLILCFAFEHSSLQEVIHKIQNSRQKKQPYASPAPAPHQPHAKGGGEYVG